jgi:tRNA A-37 threonylcarbamoyl transferase component Bud32
MPERARSSDQATPDAKDVQFTAESEFETLPTRKTFMDPRIFEDAVRSRPSNLAGVLDAAEVVEIGHDDVEPLAEPEPPVSPFGTPQQSRPNDPRIGANIGKYKVLSLIGTGGMADVYLVEHRHLGRRFALKRLKNERVNGLNMVNRFFEEARTVSQIYHPNIVEITDFIRTEEHQCYVMEYIQGKPLDEVLHTSGEFSTDRAIPIAQQLCRALGMLHRMGVVHRDIKPANLMLLPRDDVQDFVKLLDFGIARFLETDTGVSRHQTQTGMSLGTPGYMAPEQILGGPVDGRADIYAVGVLLYQMVTGRSPFVSDTWAKLIIKQTTEEPIPPSQVMSSEIPPALEALILECLSQRPEDRPQNVGAVNQRLGGICSDSAAPPGVHRATAAGRKIRPLRWMAVGAVMAVLSAVAYLTFAGTVALPPVANAAEAAESGPSRAKAPGSDDVAPNDAGVMPAVNKNKKKRVRRPRRREQATKASDKLFKQFE